MDVQPAVLVPVNVTIVVVGGVSVSLTLLLFIGCHEYDDALPVAVKLTVPPWQIVLVELLMPIDGLVFTVMHTTAVAVQFPLEPVTV